MAGAEIHAMLRADMVKRALRPQCDGRHWPRHGRWVEQSPRRNLNARSRN